MTHAPEGAARVGRVAPGRRGWIPPTLLALMALVAGRAAPAQERATSPAPEAERAPGTRIVEGAPEGGLAYRLIMNSQATPDRPDRLVMWLHPGGGDPFNDRVEGLAPIFLRHRFAVLLIVKKQFEFWTEAEARQLFGRTLPEVSRVPGLDARRPILMGFSGGGQLAISLWHARPRNYGGLILDAAFPLEDKEGKQHLMDLPAGEVKSAPIFVLVGNDDAVAESWRKVESKWREAGVPLTVRYVKGKGHQWLFGEEEKAALDEWLGAPAGGG